MFPLVAEAIGKVLPLESLRYIGFAHVEADELGSLNQFLAAAPRAVAVASQTAVPHLPHGWGNGFMMETATRTLLCGDLFTQRPQGSSRFRTVFSDS